jgi:hypothetical protein
MAYPEQYTLGETAAFQQRVQVALADIAGNLLVSGTPTSGQRAAAQRVIDSLAEPEPVCALAREVARVVVVHPTVAASAPTGASLTDAQLRTAVDLLLGALVR